MSIDWTPEAVTAASTIALAFLTLVLAVGTLVLWLATKRLVRGSEKTAERQLRAYLSIESAIRDGEHQSVPEFKSKITFKNCGQTPAYDGAMWLSIYAAPQDPPIPVLERTTITFEMPPGNIITVWPAIDSNKLLFSDEAIDGFDTGKVAIYVLGEANFKDAFDKDRWFKFRLRYDKRCFATGCLNTDEIKSN